MEFGNFDGKRRLRRYWSNRERESNYTFDVEPFKTEANIEFETGTTEKARTVERYIIVISFGIMASNCKISGSVHDSVSIRFKIRGEQWLR